MAVIGFSFIKFDCERKGTPKGNLEIKHNINIVNVEKTSLNVGSGKNDVLKVEFSYDVVYGSEVGKVSIVGDVIYADTKEIVDETFKGWEAEKKLNTTVNEQVFKFIYGKAIVKALEISDSLNLPAPIPLPKVNINPKK